MENKILHSAENLINEKYGFFVNFINDLKLMYYKLLETYNLMDYNTLISIIIFFNLYFFIQKSFMKNNKFFIVLFELPGTFIHELSHATMVVLTGGKVTKFTVLPQFTNNGVILGQVGYSHTKKNRIPFISAAPLYLNMIYLIIILNLFYSNSNLETFNIFYNLESLFFSYLSAIIISSSILSSKDLSNFFKYIGNLYFISFFIVLFLLLIFYTKNVLKFLNDFINPYNVIIENSIFFLIILSLIFIVFNLLVNLSSNRN